MAAITTIRVVHRYVLVAIFAVAAFLTALDAFIVNVGLPELGQSLGHAALSDLSWVLNAYTIVFASLLIPAGRLGDRYGNKLVFFVGFVIFALSSLGCALSDNLWLIVALRCVQAAGGAALVPTSLGLILTTIPSEHRTQAIRIWSIVGSLGAAAGPAVGGLLVALSWRWIFIINVPIGLIAAVATLLYVPDVRHRSETRIPDALGGLLLVVAIGSVALGLVQGPSWGWQSGRTIASFAVTIVAAVLFLARSARAESPIVDLGLFKDRVFSSANIVLFLSQLSFGLQLLGLILLLEETWGWSSLQTGLAIVPGPAMVSVTALGIRPRLPKIPESVVIAIGILMMGGGGILTASLLGAQPDYALDVLPGWMLIGAGAGLARARNTFVRWCNLAPHQSSTGSAVLNMSRWIGTTIGVSLLVVVLGTKAGAGVSVDSLREALWWALVPAVLGALMALRIVPRPHANPLPTPIPVVD